MNKLTEIWEKLGTIEQRLDELALLKAMDVYLQNFTNADMQSRIQTALLTRINERMEK